MSNAIINEDSFEKLTMGAPKYLVVQYIANTWRMEARNVGIILWTPTGVSARFFAEHSSGNAVRHIDSSKIPAFIDGAGGYVQWVKTWRSLLSQDALQPIRGGVPIHCSSPLYLESLKEFTNETYPFRYGGTIFDSVGDVGEAVDYLFEMLVADPNSKVEEKPTKERVDWVCSRLLSESGVRENPNFQRNYHLDPLKDKAESGAKFTYGYSGSLGLRLYEAVPLPSEGVNVERYSQSALWKFEQVFNAKTNLKKIGTAVVHVSAERRRRKEMASALELLGSKLRVINLAGQQETLLAEWQLLAHADSRARDSSGFGI